jgi:pilus assembly protein Flp/PilA
MPRRHHSLPLGKQVEKGAGEARGKEHSVAFWRDDAGQGLVEYALIIVVIAIAVVVAMVFLRGQLQNQFSNIGNNLT